MNRKTLFALLISGLISSEQAVANEFPICQSDLVKTMKRFEKTEFSIPRAIPTGKLREYALKMEILCPWQIEVDLNGDKKIDWVGVIHRQNHYELVAYFSTGKSYTSQILHRYNFFPEQTYLKISRKATKKSAGYVGKKFIYDIKEVTLNDTSRIYSLNNARFEIISQYEDVTILDSQKSNDSDDSEDID